MKTIVYHLETADRHDEDARALRWDGSEAGADAIRRLRAAGAFKPVAFLTVETLEEAFARTQNVTGSWAAAERANPENAIEDGDRRSTSVGDLIKTVDGWYMVDRIGFTPVEIPILAK